MRLCYSAQRKSSVSCGECEHRVRALGHQSADEVTAYVGKTKIWKLFQNVFYLLISPAWLRFRSSQPLTLLSYNSTIYFHVQSFMLAYLCTSDIKKSKSNTVRATQLQFHRYIIYKTNQSRWTNFKDVLRTLRPGCHQLSAFKLE